MSKKQSNPPAPMNRKNRPFPPPSPPKKDSDCVNDFSFAMNQVKEVTCKSCNKPVSGSIIQGFYECKACNSITNNVNVIMVPCIGLLRLSTY